MNGYTINLNIYLIIELLHNILQNCNQIGLKSYKNML